jgi:hypothetical protein
MMIQKVIYGTAAAIGLVLFGWYLIHIWADCLNENSIFTCMRMLNK